MDRFALRRITAVKGHQIFNKLIINDRCLFDEFEEAVKTDSKLKNHLEKIYLYMNMIANIQLLPKEKFRVLMGGPQDAKEYEFKSGSLRVYAIKDEIGQLVILGGCKNTQKEDINRLREIKKRYLASKK